MEILNSIKKLTLMKKSKCCNAEVGKVYDTKFTYYKCVHCGQECELMEQSESTASDSAKSAIAVLNDVYGKDPRSTDVFYPLSTILEAMETYTSQKDAQIQALTKEVDGLKGHIEHLESQIFTLESTEADQISQFKISGNKMAEALNMFIGQNNMSFDSCELLAKKSLELWEKLNK